MAEAINENRDKLWRLIRSFLIEIPAGVQTKNKNHYVIHSIITYFALIAHTLSVPFFWFIGVKQLSYINILVAFF